MKEKERLVQAKLASVRIVKDVTEVKETTSVRDMKEQLME